MFLRAKANASNLDRLVDQVANEQGDDAVTQDAPSLVTLAQLAEASRQAVEGLATELALRGAVVNDALHATARDQQMVYLAAWIHQPYAGDAVALLSQLLPALG